MITIYFAVSTTKTGTEGLFNSLQEATEQCEKKGFVVGEVSNPREMFARRPILKAGRRIGWITAAPVIR